MTRCRRSDPSPEAARAEHTELSVARSRRRATPGIRPDLVTPAHRLSRGDQGAPSGSEMESGSGPDTPGGVQAPSPSASTRIGFVNAKGTKPGTTAR